MRPIIYFTDLHISTKSTKSVRKPCWNVASEALLWVFNLAKELDAVAILSGGDITESYNWTSSDSFLLWQLLNKTPVDVFTVIGNHDVPGGNLGLLPFTGMGQVINPDINYLSKAISVNPYGLKLLDSAIKLEEFNIVGFHWNDPLCNGDKLNFTNVDKKFSDSNISFEKTKDQVNILVSHAPVGKEDNDYTLHYSELKIDPRIDFALFGDIHSGFGPYKLKNGVVVGNPSAAYRKTFQEAKYVPGVFIIWPNKEIEWKAIPSDSPNEAFFMDLHTQKKRSESLNFSAAVAASKVAKSTDPKQYIKEVGLEAGFDQKAINEVIKRLESVDK